VLRSAGLMMEAALAVRGYTVKQVKPLLEPQLAETFLPQSVPAYAASQTFDALHAKYPDYSYKEALLNPTNPRNKAVEWETDIVNSFRNASITGEFSGERDTPVGRMLYMARPIQIKDAACLACHTVPAMSPASMVKLYGESNGYGWKLQEIVGRPGGLGADVAADQERRPRLHDVHGRARGDLRGHLRRAERHALGHDHPPDLEDVGLGGQDLAR
jgi:protein-histidine pros-kinase